MFKKYWLVFVLALCVGLEVVFPQILFMYQAGQKFQGFNIFQTDAEYFYLSRIREVYDGHYNLGNALLSAGKNLPYAQPPLAEWIMGFTGVLLHIDIGTILILFRFIAPVVLFCFIYALVVALSGNKRAGMTASAFTILASNLISTPLDLWHMIRGRFTDSLFLDYARPINPQISSLFFFGFLLLYWRLWQTGKRRYTVLCALVFGLSFYVYPYTWSLLLVWLTLLTVLALWQRRSRDVWQLLAIISGGFVLAIPYAINLYQLTHQPSFTELSNAWGLYPGRPFTLGSILIIAFLLLVLIKKLQPTFFTQAWWFLLGLVLAGFIAINNQVVTGKVFYYGHYHWYYNKPFFAIITMVALFVILDFLHVKKIPQNAVVGLLLAIFFYNGFMVQWASYQAHAATYLGYQSYGPVISWFNQHATKDAVVYVPESYYYPISGRNEESDTPSLALSRFIVTYTPLNLYFSEYVNFYLMPYDQYKQYNLYIVLKLLNVEPQNAYTFLRANPDFFFNVYYAYFRVRGLTYRDMPDDWIRQAADAYRTFYDQSWPNIFHKYPLNYIAWDRTDLPNLPFEQIRTQYPDILNVVYDAHNVIIYQVH